MLRPGRIDYALLLTVGFMWGSQFSLNEVAIRSFGPLTIGAGRLVFGVIALTIVILAFPSGNHQKPAEPIHHPWRLYAVIAVVEAIIPLVFIPWGQRTVDSAVAAIILALVPVIVLVLAPFFSREDRWTRAAAISVALGFAGVVVLMLPSLERTVFAGILGELMILFAAVCYAMGMILMRRVPHISPFLAMRNIFALGAVPVVLLALIVERPWTVPLSWDSIFALVALGVFCGGLSYGLFLYAVMRTGPTFASLVGYLVTLFGVIIGIVFMRDPFGANDIVAVILIAAALAVARLQK